MKTIGIKSEVENILQSPEWQSFYQRLLFLLPKGVVLNNPILPFFSGYSYGTLYDWDQYFEAIVQLYAGWSTDYIKNGIKIFLSKQEGDGKISRAIPANDGTPLLKHQTHVKPFLAQEILLCLHHDGNIKWLTNELYGKLKKYLIYWLEHEDKRGAGLAVWRESEHTGMDNQFERAGTWGENESFCEGVDLNSYLVRECRAMSIIADLAGNKKDSSYFSEKANSIKEAINRWCWNEKDGIYYDFNAQTKEPIKVKYVGAFASLWAGIADQTQAERMLNEHLLNTDEFWRDWPIPALAANEPGYVTGYLTEAPRGGCSWRAHTWIPTNYYTFHGLLNYGLTDAAFKLAEKTGKLFRRGPFSEYYVTEGGVGTGLKPFWGWSSLAIFIEPEFSMNLDPTELKEHNQAVAKMRSCLEAIQ